MTGKPIKGMRLQLLHEKVMVMLHLSEQLKKGRDGDTVELHFKPVLQQNTKEQMQLAKHE